MKIGIVKPDYKIVGGFEIVVNQLKCILETSGNIVEIIGVDVTQPSLRDIPYKVSSLMYEQNPEFFKYINMFWKFMKMDLSGYDLVISTQPPSFAINHPNHISLFYHHSKIHYDLSALIQEVGLQCPNHRKAVEVIREIDTLSLSKVSVILAGSKTIKKRIEKYNNITNNVDVIYAGIDQDIYNYKGSISYKYPIVVGRHEFPKRPELFIAAMKKIPDQVARIVGNGGRSEDLKKIDSLLTITNQLDINISDDVIWKRFSNGYIDNQYLELLQKNKKKLGDSNIIFTGRVTKNQLLNEYANALCVVCPAYEEDYGLTAIEAMAFKKPVIACNDGGGYTELIEDGVNGFIVEPNSDAIADALRVFIENPEKAKVMGLNAFETSRRYSWSNTNKKLLTTIKELM